MRPPSPLTITAAITAGVIILAGCTGPNPADEPATPAPAETAPSATADPTPAETDAPGEPETSADGMANRCDPFDDELLEPGQYCGMVTGKIRDDVPAIERIRYVTPGEQQDVIGECLDQAGFPGYPEFTTSGEAQQMDLERQYHICFEQYPLDPKFDPVNLTTETQSIIYDWFVNETMPCLIAAGYPVSDPPSKETWMAAPGHVISRWSPYDALEEQDFELAVQVQEQCPRPPHEVLYPDE